METGLYRRIIWNCNVATKKFVLVVQTLNSVPFNCSRCWFHWRHGSSLAQLLNSAVTDQRSKLAMQAYLFSSDKLFLTRCGGGGGGGGGGWCPPSFFDVIVNVRWQFPYLMSCVSCRGSLFVACICRQHAASNPRPPTLIPKLLPPHAMTQTAWDTFVWFQFPGREDRLMKIRQKRDKPEISAISQGETCVIA